MDSVCIPDNGQARQSLISLVKIVGNQGDSHSEGWLRLAQIRWNLSPLLIDAARELAVAQRSRRMTLSACTVTDEK